MSSEEGAVIVTSTPSDGACLVGHVFCPVPSDPVDPPDDGFVPQHSVLSPARSFQSAHSSGHTSVSSLSSIGVERTRKTESSNRILELSASHRTSHMLSNKGVLNRLLLRNKSTDDDDTNTRNNVLYPIIAAVIMHAPGLQVKYAFEDWNVYSTSLFSAVIEGVLLLMFTTRVLHNGRSVCVALKEVAAPWYVLHGSMVLSGGLLLYLSGFIVSSILGDATYRAMSGNEGPSAEQILAGFGNAKEHVAAQFANNPMLTIFRFVLAVTCYVVSFYVYLFPRLKLKSLNGTLQLPKPNFRHIYVLGLLSCLLNFEGCYTPVVFSSFCLYFDRFNISTGVPNLTGNTMIQQRRNSFSSISLPNVIFIQHESLSGSIMLNTEKGRESTPFFQNMMHNDDDMYVFEHSRSVSGNTIDAMPALMTGCLPLNKEGIDNVRTKGRSVGYEFYKRGYNTASFSSRALDGTIISGQWSILHDPLTGGMYRVFDPLSESAPKNNAEGCDDVMMLNSFSQWLSDTKNGTTHYDGDDEAPFYAQFYNFNQHFPYFVGDKGKAGTHRYYSSLATTDGFLKDLFNLLNETGKLENTIIVGSGDHGDDPIKTSYVRMSALTPNILHTISYIYYPKALLRDRVIANRLRRNTHQLTHTLDLYPTLLSILHPTSKSDDGTVGHHTLNSTDSFKGCATGFDLTAVDIADDRVTLASNMVSATTVRSQRLQLRAISTKDYALYHRKSHSSHPQLKQGKNDAYMLIFGAGCTSNPEDLCVGAFDDDGREYFVPYLDSLKNSSLVDEETKESELVRFFESIVREGTR